LPSGEVTVSGAEFPGSIPALNGETGNNKRMAVIPTLRNI